MAPPAVSCATPWYTAFSTSGWRIRLARGILRFFEIDDPVYSPTPSWDFYRKYRKLMNDAKKEVDRSLSPSNAAFSGFLMMTVLP